MTESDRPSAYIEPLNVRAREAREQPRGLPLIGMAFNELPFPPTPAVSAAIQNATAQANLYGNPGCDLLRSRLAAVHGVDPEALVCANGSEELLDMIGRCFVRPGDEIVIPEYGYIQFPIVAHRVGATLVKAPETDFTTSVDSLLAAVTDRTRLIFVANPNNPTGTMVSADDLRRLADGVPSHIVLVFDLAYGEFVGFDYCAAAHELVRNHDNVVVTRTFSKAFGIAGLRVGWCHTPEWMVPVLNAARPMGPVNAAAQAGAVAALGELDTVESRVATIVAERERVAAELASLGLSGAASSTNFLLTGFDGDDGRLADELADHLFDDAAIVVNRTREAGLERFIRFSLSLPAHNDLLLESVTRFLVG
ncbi:MAG: histidinol-phosphate transaminase [Actinomycetota bacterium]|nr:histidinol-phosphate transaminase [Actinomycetota bacterium]